ncbi:hypothetical protein DPMN_037267 [Dreissena polymorpha]|uniref:Uncharacterized protein n=1 Tax=Dreissena polymorpha TaxID=45954 RepID=A0A9D4MD24_DREPO|nr:hypothetical protein DPMN_037267 [Dreissena polymorpha]
MYSLCARLRWKVLRTLQPMAHVIRFSKDMFTLALQSTFPRRSCQISAHQAVPKQRTASVPTTTKRP